MDAKAFLNQVPRINSMIKNKLYEIEMVRNSAFDISASIGEIKVQKSGSSSKMENIVVSYLDMEKEIGKEIKKLVERKNKVVRVIEELPTIQYDLLYKVYVLEMTLYEVAEIGGYSYRWATGLHSKSLKSVQKILDEEKCAKKEGS